MGVKKKEESHKNTGNLAKVEKGKRGGDGRNLGPLGAGKGNQKKTDDELLTPIGKKFR